MSEATVKALTDAIYDALEGSEPARELDNEQVYEAARLAAQTVESAGTTKAIVRAWLEEIGWDLRAVKRLMPVAPTVPVLDRLVRMEGALREVSS